MPAHEVDGLHHGLVPDLVRVHETQQEVDARGLVALARVEALLGRSEHARAGVDEVFERQEVEGAVVGVRPHGRGVVVVAELLLALLHPLRDLRDLARPHLRVPLERFARRGVRLVLRRRAQRHRERGGLVVDELPDRARALPRPRRGRCRSSSSRPRARRRPRTSTGRARARRPGRDRRRSWSRPRSAGAVVGAAWAARAGRPASSTCCRSSSARWSSTPRRARSLPATSRECPWGRPRSPPARYASPTDRFPCRPDRRSTGRAPPPTRPCAPDGCTASA